MKYTDDNWGQILTNDVNLLQNTTNKILWCDSDSDKVYTVIVELSKFRWVIAAASLLGYVRLQQCLAICSMLFEALKKKALSKKYNKCHNFLGSVYYYHV